MTGLPASRAAMSRSSKAASLVMRSNRPCWGTTLVDGPDPDSKVGTGRRTSRCPVRPPTKANMPQMSRPVSKPFHRKRHPLVLLGRL